MGVNEIIGFSVGTPFLVYMYTNGYNKVWDKTCFVYQVIITRENGFSYDKTTKWGKGHQAL